MALTPSDDELMSRVGNGDRQAFTTLLDRHGAAVFGYCMRTLAGNQALAEDISQEVWFKVVKQASRYEARGHFKAWLMTVTRNETVSHLRRSLPLGMDAESHEAELASGEDLELRLAEGIETAAVQKAIDSLPDAQRVALGMWVNEDLSYEQIAEALGSTVPGVRSLLFRARQELRKKLERQ